MKFTNNTLVKVDGNNYVIHYYYGTQYNDDVFSLELKRVFNDKGGHINLFDCYSRAQLESWVQSGLMEILDSSNADFRAYEANKLKL